MKRPRITIKVFTDVDNTFSIFISTSRKLLSPIKLSADWLWQFVIDKRVIKLLCIAITKFSLKS